MKEVNGLCFYSGMNSGDVFDSFEQTRLSFFIICFLEVCTLIQADRQTNKSPEESPISLWLVWYTNTDRPRATESVTENQPNPTNEHEFVTSYPHKFLYVGPMQ